MDSLGQDASICLTILPWVGKAKADCDLLIRGAQANPLVLAPTDVRHACRGSSLAFSTRRRESAGVRRKALSHASATMLWTQKAGLLGEAEPGISSPQAPPPPPAPPSTDKSHYRRTGDTRGRHQARHWRRWILLDFLWRMRRINSCCMHVVD